jgi:hypothetical protein
MKPTLYEFVMLVIALAMLWLGYLTYDMAKAETVPEIPQQHELSAEQ